MTLKTRDKSKSGAIVQFCGHRGTFIADVYEVAGACVFHAAKAPVNGDTIRRDNYERATHHISDFPDASFWKPHLGIFVVPSAQVKLLKP